MDNIQLGDKLKNARKAKNLTQKDLADLIGAKHNSVSNWENNQNKPDPDTIELICGVLDITPNYLLSTTSDEFSPHEKLLLRNYRKLDSHGKQLVETFIDMELKRIEQFNDEKTQEESNPIRVAARGGYIELTKDEAVEFAKSSRNAPNEAHNKELF